MGAIRIQNEFYTEQGTQYKVEIWDNDYASSTITTLVNNGFEIEYDRCDRFTTTMLPSTCYYTLYDDGSVAFAQFRTDLANAQEDEFKMVIYRKFEGGSYNIFWAGVIMSDMITWDNTPAPRPFEIIAKCGLNRLENIYFDKILSSPYSSDPLQSLKTIIFDCLSYAATAQFWNGESKPYISCNIEWFDTQQTSITQAKILHLIYIGREYLVDSSARKDDTQPYRGKDDPPRKAKDVLHDILQLFCCRLFLSDGTWHVQQLTKMDVSTYTQGEYNYAGTYTGSSVKAILLPLSSTFYLLANGKFSNYPSLKSVKARMYPSVVFSGTEHLITGVYGGSTTMTGGTQSLGTLYGGASVGNVIMINVIYDRMRWHQKYSSDFYVEVAITLTCGSYRIKNTETNQYGLQDGGNAEWTTTAGDKYKFCIFGSKTMTIDEDKGRVFSIVTPEIPFASEASCTMQITATLKTISGKNNYPSSINDLYIYFQRQEVGLYNTSLNPPELSKVAELELENPNTTANSFELDLGYLYIESNFGQTPISNHRSIMVSTSDTITLVRSVIWNTGHTTNKNIVFSMLRAIIALQDKSIKKYIGSFVGMEYNAFQTINYDSSQWVFMGGRYTAKTEIWDGEWFAIVWNTTIVPDEVTREYNSKQAPFVPVKSGRPWTPDKYSNGGVYPMARMDNNFNSGDTITSIDIEDCLYEKHILEGDKVMIINSGSGQLIQEFVADADVSENDTLISVQSDTAAEDTFQGNYITHDPREVVASNNVRATQLLQALERFVLGLGNQTVEQRILKRDTTDAASTELTTDGGSPSAATNRIAVATDTILAGTITITAKGQGNSKCFMALRQFTILNDGGSTTLVSSSTIGTDIMQGFATVSVALSANDTDECLKVDVTGEAVTNIRWVADVRFVKNIYA